MKYLALLPLWLIVTLFGHLFNWAFVLCAKDGHLPRWLAYFDTPDNSLDGDKGFRTKHAPFKGDQTGLKRYINRVFWLHRNCAYGFRWSVLAFKASPDAVLTFYGDTFATDNHPIREGCYFKRLTNPDGESCWQLYMVLRRSDAKLMEFNLGWKIWDWIPGKAVSLQYVFSPSPNKTVRT